MNTWEITNLANAKTLAAKLRRWMRSERNGGYVAVRQQGDTLIVTKSGDKPWGELTGYMTQTTEIHWLVGE